MKKIAKQVLSACGIRVSRDLSDGWDPRYLGQVGGVDVVVDVGVGFGTPELYAAFPSAKLVLCEPLETYRECLEKLAEQREVKLIFKAIGSHVHTQEIRIEKSSPTKSSLMERGGINASGPEVEVLNVEVVPLDSLEFAEPGETVLLKIDTEGYEVNVIKGASESLKKIKWVIAEVSVAPRFVEGYRFDEFIELMKDNHFQVRDILRVARRRGHFGAVFADVLFERVD